MCIMYDCVKKIEDSTFKLCTHKNSKIYALQKFVHIHQTVVTYRWQVSLIYLCTIENFISRKCFTPKDFSHQLTLIYSEWLTGPHSTTPITTYYSNYTVIIMVSMAIFQSKVTLLQLIRKWHSFCVVFHNCILDPM